MSDLELDWVLTDGSEDGAFGQTTPNINGDVAALPDCGLSELNLLSRTSCSLNSGASEADNFPDIFRNLLDVQFHPAPPLPAMTSIVTKRVSRELEEGESSKGKRKADEMEFRKCLSEGIDGVSGGSKRKKNVRTKSTRSAEIHNMYERRRRDRIKGKMRALQELIPNCNKSDRASMLDEAIEYLKSLKLQVQAMSMGGGALCQAPYFSPFVPMRPGLGMGMASICCPTGFPMIPVPLARLHPPLSATAHSPQISGPGVLRVPQMQVPFIPSQPLAETAATSNALPTFVTEFSPTFNISNQGESSSQNIHRIANDFEQVPNGSQKSSPSVSHSTVHGTRIILPSSHEWQCSG